ncbi:MAG: site-specific DNA-methyltransferase [Elusimicrobiota bacterium]
MKAKKQKKLDVVSYYHEDKKRVNNPPVGLVSSETDKLTGRTRYEHDPHIDPYLSWAGKKENSSFEVQNVSLHIHERIDSQRIIQAFLKPKEKEYAQPSLFESPGNNPPLNRAIDFYKHEQDWSNRLIAGDSLLVMNSLLKKEGMAGKVQMVFFDPPYGVKYNSNFQPFVNKHDVRDGNDGDIPAEPEMIQAFRDTWELGIHSYLTYLRERLFLAKEMLHESGSCFVQISDENVHRVRNLMDEIFGQNNFVVTIVFTKTGSKESGTVDPINDYLVWYSKDKKKVKLRKLFENRTIEDLHSDGFKYLLHGKLVNNIPDDFNSELVVRGDPITSDGFRPTTTIEIEFEGKKYFPGNKNHWKTSFEGLNKLNQQGRLLKGTSLQYLRKLSDFPVKNFTNVWNDLGGASNMVYVVQTNEKVIQRCILLTTDPGDLVFDPTCGSGTTAFVAEQWGRRWITCDTSRVAITLAKQRLMTTKYDYYELAYPKEGVKSGFRYKTVPHVTLSSIANDEPAKQETLYDQPYIVSGKVRVTGPFTVEAVPCLKTPNVKPIDGKMPKAELTNEQYARTGETAKYNDYLDELRSTGIRTVGNKIIKFSRVEPMIGTTYIHAVGEVVEGNSVTKKVYLSFGPDYGPLEQRQVENAFREAHGLKEKPDIIIFSAFHFDPEAAKDIDEMASSGIAVLKTQMSVDLLTKDLRKNRSSNQSYWLIGQPDIEVIKLKDKKYKVRVNGFDYYNPLSGEIESKDNKHIAMWFLDTDYDDRSLYPAQVFFPEADAKRGWTRLAKALNGEVNEELLEKFTGVESLPFTAGENNKIAVKIVDLRGIESFVVKKLG